MTKLIRIAEFAGPEGVLAGTLLGRAIFPRLEQIVRESERGSLLLLDMTGVTILTSSFFVASLWAVFWTGQAAQRRDLYPIVFRAADDPKEEIRIALKAKRSPALFATGEEDSFQVEPYNLERVSQETLEHVIKRGAATAADLAGLDPHVGKTAWNNRLAQLHQQRILRKSKVGRQLKYSPCWRF